MFASRDFGVLEQEINKFLFTLEGDYNGMNIQCLDGTTLIAVVHYEKQIK
jgi:hypothetical protein